MKLIKLLVIPVALIVLLSLSLTAGDAEKSTTTDNSKINWLSYDEGLKKAKEENKHVFIDFTTAWCGYCKKMEREAFADPKVIDLLNNHFVPVRVDGDSKDTLDIDGYQITEKDLTRREYGVSGYPTFWWLKPDGSKLGRQPGYQTTEWMIGALEYVKDYKYDTTKTNQSQTNSDGK